MLELTPIWKDRGVRTNVKLKLLRALIWTVVTYGSEAWTLKKYEENKIEAAEMWFYRRLLKVSWTERRTNESILKELKVKLKVEEEQFYTRRDVLSQWIRNIFIPDMMFFPSGLGTVLYQT